MSAIRRQTDKQTYWASHTDLAWAAGFFDGEGSTGAYDNGKGSFHLMVQVNQRKLEPLLRLKRIFGFGHITGPYRKKQFTIYRWAIRNFECIQAFIVAIWPWLSNVKRRQYKRALRLVHR